MSLCQDVFPFHHGETSQTKSILYTFSFSLFSSNGICEAVLYSKRRDVTVKKLPVVLICLLQNKDEEKIRVREQIPLRQQHPISYLLALGTDYGNIASSGIRCKKE